jgi:spermidine/putrescine transport system permease protein
MWMNTMLRTYAWRAFLSDTGVLNNFLTKIGATSSPIHFLDSGSVTIDVVIKMVMISDFLPFMILPIYNTIAKLDGSLTEAARDLGANERRAFLRVTLPLSLPGIISGVSMVFLPAMTNYVVLDMLYNSTYIMGSLIGSYFNAYNWHGGSMIALVLLGIICVFSLITNGKEDEEAKTGGALL